MAAMRKTEISLFDSRKMQGDFVRSSLFGAVTQRLFVVADVSGTT
jgi:hypothetical protein